MNIAIFSPFRRFKVGSIAKGGSMLLAMILGLAMAFPSYALDLTNLGGVAGPLGDALTQLGDLSDGVKALIGFIGFVVALISLASLRNMGPVLFYVGLCIFGAVGLAVAGAIMGASVGGLASIGAL